MGGYYTMHPVVAVIIGAIAAAALILLSTLFLTGGLVRTECSIVTIYDDNGKVIKREISEFPCRQRVWSDRSDRSDKSDKSGEQHE